MLFFGDVLGCEEYITVLQNEQRNTIIKVGGVPIKMIENFNIISRIIAKHTSKSKVFTTPSGLFD